MSKVEVVKQVKWHLHEKTSCDTPSIDNAWTHRTSSDDRDRRLQPLAE
jgi:hypothetical protein